MAEIVNLRRARKSKARTEKDKAAAEARAAHGRTKAERKLETAKNALARKRLDAHKKDPKA